MSRVPRFCRSVPELLPPPLIDVYENRFQDRVLCAYSSSCVFEHQKVCLIAEVVALGMKTPEEQEVIQNYWRTRPK